MRKKERLVFTFFIFLALSIIILVLSLFGKLAWPQSFLEKGASFLPKTFFGFFQGLPFVSESSLVKFQTKDIQTLSLLPAQIVGAPGFVPGITTPSNFILDKGAKDNVGVGDSVIVGNNLVGKVSKVSSYLSKVDIVTNPLVAFSAKTVSGAIGVIKGAGADKITLDNVLPSENLKLNELVLTKGDVDIDGTGIQGDLIVGKIQSIEKVPTNIFQRAEVKSLVNFTKQSIVFIIIKI